MKKLFSLILALAMLLCMIPAQATAAEITSEVMIAPQYEAARDFSDGYAAVKKDGKWGYIDEEGNVVVDFQFDWAGYYAEGVAVVATIETVNDWEYYVFRLIDMEGMNVVLSDSQNIWSAFDEKVFGCVPNHVSNYEGIEEDMAQWDNFYNCNNGVVRVSDVCYTPDGKEIILKEEEKAKLFVPTWGDYEEPFDYFYSFGPAVDGVIPMVAAYVGQVTNWNQAFFMDLEGNIIRTFEPVNYEDGTGICDVLAPNEGLTLARIPLEEDPEYPGSWITAFGLLDEAGEWAVEPIYHMYRYYLSGWYIIEDRIVCSTHDKLWGAVDTKGNVVVPFEYKHLDMSSNGFSAAQKQDGTYVYLGDDGYVYQIGSINGGIAEVVTCTHFGSEGIAAVLDSDGNAYCISSKPIDGVLPAIQNSENLDPRIYFPEYEEGGDRGLIHPPTEIVVIQEDGLYGYMRVDVNLVINPFEDVEEDAFYYEPVLWAVENDITQGVSETQFAPKNDCTRAQVVTFLHRAAGSEVVENAQIAFTDVQKGKFYTDAVAWAVEKNVTNGMGDGTFGTGNPCTRGQVVTFLWRTAGEPEPTLEECEFTDVKEDAFYYKAVLWAVEKGITNGMGDGTFGVGNTCNRGQIVTFLYRYVNGE